MDDTGSGQTQIAYDFIREKIMAGEMLPGKPLTALQLSKLIGVSRTPVRDALRQLEGEGIVTFKPNIGATVRSLSLDEFRAHCGVRLALETYAAGEAARLRRDSDLRDLETQFKLLKEFCEKSVSGRASAAHARQRARHDVYFHLVIAEAARNDVLKREVLRLCIMNRFVASETLRGDWETSHPEDADQAASENMNRIIKEHEAILEAIREKDIAAARTAMEIHIQRLIDALDRSSLAAHHERMERMLKI